MVWEYSSGRQQGGSWEKGRRVDGVIKGVRSKNKGSREHQGGKKKRNIKRERLTIKTEEEAGKAGMEATKIKREKEQTDNSGKKVRTDGTGR